MDTKDLAKRIRVHALNMTSNGGSAHIGSIFSISDILAVLYGSVLSFDIKNPKWELRDRFILSKGHAGAGVYAVLAEVGFFNVEKLKTHYQDGSDLSGHVSHKAIPGVEFSTGSLGHGLSVGAGMALAAKFDKRDNKVVVLLSDGECDEGSNWEAILFAAHHKLSNLIAIIDYNKIQSLDTTENTLNLEPFNAKWTAFGWDVIEVDGHDHDELKKVLTKSSGNKPVCIIAHTTKGKGVSFMENQVLWHYRTAKGNEFDNAMEELTA
ncbi:MAG: transketolase [Bacteroidota bacterium]